MSDGIPCESCGTPLPTGKTICSSCGWDLTTAVTKRPRPPIGPILRAVGLRLLVYGALLALMLGGYQRLRSTGPGPDLATTLRWIVLGDGGRSAELVTIHRAHEIAAASARYAIENLMAPVFEDDWAGHLERFSTVEVRGWVPLLFYAASRQAGDKVLELYEVRDTDGWGNPYCIEVRKLEKGVRWETIPFVQEDLEQGLQVSFFERGTPDFSATEWARLQLESAGNDGSFDTDDDIRFISYFPVDPILDLHDGIDGIQRQLEIAQLLGRNYYRLEGNRWDLIDARILAEQRVDLMW